MSCFNSFKVFFFFYGVVFLNIFNIMVLRLQFFYLFIISIIFFVVCLFFSFISFFTYVFLVTLSCFGNNNNNYYYKFFILEVLFKNLQSGFLFFQGVSLFSVFFYCFYVFEFVFLNLLSTSGIFLFLLFYSWVICFVGLHF